MAGDSPAYDSAGGGTATLTNCTVSGNTANGTGGGLFLKGPTINLRMHDQRQHGDWGDGGGLANPGTGTATLTNCIVSGNTATQGRRRLDESRHGHGHLTDCTISGNTAGTAGGGLANYGTATLTNCTVSGNTAGAAGGGLGNYGTATLTNCTISGNTATGNGGGLLNVSGANLTATNCTVSGNTAKNKDGGGLFNAGTAKLSNTIIAGNNASTGPDADGTVLSQGHNLIGITDGSSGWVSTDLTGTGSSPLNPLLAALGNYGGPTQTMALLPGSPAIDAGSSSVPTDQRGVSRPKGSAGDIGAFESSGFTMVTSGSGQSANITEPFASPLVVTVTANNPVEPVAGGQVSFSAPTSGASASLSVQAGDDRFERHGEHGRHRERRRRHLLGDGHGHRRDTPRAILAYQRRLAGRQFDERRRLHGPGCQHAPTGDHLCQHPHQPAPRRSRSIRPHSKAPRRSSSTRALPDLSNTAVPIAINGPGHVATENPGRRKLVELSWHRPSIRA